MRENRSDMSTLTTLEKCVNILSLFAQATPTLSVYDIAERLDLPKSTVYRYLSALKHHDLLEEDTKPGNYRLGRKVIEWARSALVASLEEIARPYMERLSRQTGETIVLAGLRHHEGVCLEKVEGHHALRVTHERGATFPLHAGATGKVLMAHLSQEEQDATIDDVGLPRFCETTITDPQQLRTELDRIKEQGFTESDGETIVGSYSVAAPIFGRAGRIVAALSVSAPRQRIDKTIRETMIALIVEAAQEITNRVAADAAA